MRIRQQLAHDDGSANKVLPLASQAVQLLQDFIVGKPIHPRLKNIPVGTAGVELEDFHEAPPTNADLKPRAQTPDRRSLSSGRERCADVVVSDRDVELGRQRINVGTPVTRTGIATVRTHSFRLPSSLMSTCQVPVCGRRMETVGQMPSGTTTPTGALARMSPGRAGPPVSD
jgi:hypothetical protein